MSRGLHPSRQAASTQMPQDSQSGSQAQWRHDPWRGCWAGVLVQAILPAGTPEPRSNLCIHQQSRSKGGKMKAQAGVLTALTMLLLCAMTIHASPCLGASAGGLRISSQGPFTDLGIWLYRTQDGKYGFGDATVGSNERLIMPPPKPPPGATVSGVMIKRHSFDTLGYPLHIALIEKLFAQSNSIEVDATNNGEIWSYKSGDSATQESMVAGKGRPLFTFAGPFPADGAIPDDMRPAYVFATGALGSIENMPDSQKDLKNYVVLFVVATNTIWVEFGPRFGSGELPHLGCQTQLGRDMVFGYDKQQQQQGTTVGKFLQCF